MGDSSKVKFAIAREVSPEHFKSSFARLFVTNCRESKSLDYTIFDTTVEDAESNKKFFSLVNFEGRAPNTNNIVRNDNVNVWKANEVVQPITEYTELERLRKQCNLLIEENHRLQNALTSNQVHHVRVVDSVYLQTQVETLQWQLKQIDANRHMYRSTMEQVVRFLDRARKSLDILHEKTTLKDKNSSARVPRSRSVHAVHAEPSPNCVSGTSSYSSETSRFIRAKSVTQISSCTTGYREFTWSMLRRNDSSHCTPPRSKPQDSNKTLDCVVYRRPKQPELDPNDIPPEKLSQEAFRLMRTVQSLLAMNEPDLTRMSSVENTESSPSPIDHRYIDHHNEISLQSNSFVNSTSLQGANDYNRRSICDHENESSSTDNDSRSCCLKSNSVETDRSLQNLLPGARRSYDANSLNSGSSKTTEEEDGLSNNNSFNVSLPQHNGIFMCTPTSTPIRHARKVEKKDMEKCTKSKPTASVSSVEDESGFSSMSSFQEIGLPNTLQISPIRGCHTEVGLPEVPLDKTRHRRWSSTPVEIKAIFKQRNSFSTPQTNAESLSVWV